MDAQKSLRVLRDKWAGCTKCSLAQHRGSASVIFGAGHFRADFLLIVDSPTADDISDGLLLSGESGQLVEDMLAQAGIDPAKNVFRTSLVGCRPFIVLPATDDTPERQQDRTPDKTEVEACSPRVLESIYLVDPRIIITMGDGPWKSLVPPKSRNKRNTIAQAAGELFDTEIPGRLRSVRYPVLATLSPAQIVANPSQAAHGPITTTIEAFMRARLYVETLKKDEE